MQPGNSKKCPRFKNNYNRIKEVATIENKEKTVIKHYKLQCESQNTREKKFRRKINNIEKKSTCGSTYMYIDVNPSIHTYIHI